MFPRKEYQLAVATFGHFIERWSIFRFRSLALICERFDLQTIMELVLRSTNVESFFFYFQVIDLSALRRNVSTDPA